MKNDSSLHSQLSTFNSQLPKGYKQTEVGVIPEDWDVIRLAQLTSGIGDGIHSTPEYVKSSGYHFINGNNLVDGTILITDSTMCVSEAEWRKLRKDLSGYTILMSINGTIGNLAFYGGERIILGKSAAYLNVVPEISKEYIFYSLSTTLTGKYFENELTGTTIRNLSLVSLRNTPIPIPREAVEQRAIAGALSDLDALIRALDSALAKKRDLKQAAMQQLLTGQKRLPGFHGEWEVKRLGDESALITKGTTPTSLGKDFKKSGVNFIKVESMTPNGEFIKDKFGFIDGETHNLLKRSQLQDGDLLISIAGALGRTGIVNKDILPANTNQAFSIVRLKNNSGINIQFIYYLLRMEKTKKHIEGISVQGALANLSLQNIADLAIECPSLLEQTAIAEVLSDMDAELAALEQRRDKTRVLKQGMMQELLTGRVRLTKLKIENG
jgi:type I restriction enzyme S subunit